MSVTPRPIGCYVVELLAANGIDTVFGIPGVHNLELYRGLARQPGMRHVLARHEQGAGFAADGHARISGRPAAAFVISGPGVSNVLTATAQAYSDSVPMLVVASTPHSRSLGQRWGVLHDLNDQHGVMASVLDCATTATTALAVRDALQQAFAMFHSGRPRPAYLGVPLDVLAMNTDLPAQRFEQPVRPLANAEDIAGALSLLEGSRRPMIIAGGGARRAAGALRQLVENLDAYLATTASGKGLLPEDHPGNLGCSLPYAPTQRLLAEADLVLAVGTDLTETDIYTADRLALSGKLIRIDIADRQDFRHPAAISMRADAAPTLTSLAAASTARSGWRSMAGGAAVHRAHIEAGFDSRTRLLQCGLAAIRAALPADAAVFGDMTQIAYLGNYAFAADEPGVWHHPSGYGTLGHALPAALGAKVANPERAVVALAGDFGLQFTLGELATAVELELALPIVVWNNAALGQIRDDMIATGIAPLGVVARNPDFVALAEACGATGLKARSTRELTAAIRAALQRRGPTLIEVLETEFVAA